MLLSSLSIFVGAILVPVEYLWLYSTYIILVCLYLIRIKGLIVTCLTLISFISIVFHEFSATEPLSLFSGQKLGVNVEREEIYLRSTEVLQANNKARQYDVNLVFFLKDGSRQTFEHFNLIPVSSFDNLFFNSLGNPLIYGVIKKVIWPEKNGTPWQRKLYVERKLAQIDVRFESSDLDRLQISNVPEPREWLLARLDNAMQGFSSWRFSKALLLGVNDLWSERDTWIVRVLGLAHLFVVSGLHTGFIFVIGRLLSRCVWQFCPDKLLLAGLSRWHCDFVIIEPLLLFFAYITNWGEPVIRASIMLSVYMCARMLALKVSPYGIITFALWLVLLVEPRSILSPGLWLSFSMVYLLIGFCQLSTKLSRLLILQVMLSTASMVLILGWQEGISSSSILMNVFLIPVAGVIWFPWGMMACFEVLIFGTLHSYQILDYGLGYIEGFWEWAAFTAPVFYFDHFSSTIPRTIMLLLVAYWVYQSPLKRGMLSVLVIWCVLFSPVWLHLHKADIQIENKANILAVKNRVNSLITDTWAGGDLSKLLFNGYLGDNIKGRYILAPNAMSSLTPQSLLQHEIDWIIFKRPPPKNIQSMLKALNVNWLLVSSGESLNFYFQDNRITLRHSNCIYSFFLLKSDTCKRVEKLESVVNYLQT
ncbi:ComEC/Rec2 family competence protein [Marinomonas sp. 5E14-1]|uniref:ComEC/Rec2 family competence protein n=1 Tax=Marinomonas sp. 5E14-1 TaxID=3153922 RepID=UPI00326402D8